MISALMLSLLLAAGGDVSGVVHDPTGAVVPGASVVVRAPSGEHRALTGPDGRFTVAAPETGDVTVVVRADGFAETQRQVAAGTANLDITLAPASLLQEVTVTATRSEQRLGDVPASVTVLSSEDIRQSPALVADDVLRQAPEFSLFRRTSSLSSHPTAQGVSLRGLGPSGVSRTLVLLDGVPFNDPFGGWVYWTRVPLESTDRVEVVDSSTSSLYGNYAMGGVINIVTNRPARRTVEFKPQYGNKNSPKADLFASDVWGKVGASVDASLFDTDGFPVVVASERGPIDTNATVNFKNVNAKLDYNPTSRLNAFFRSGYFREKRNNGKFSTFDGTPEANDTTWKYGSGGIRLLLPDSSDLQARVFGDDETFHSNFLAVPNLQTRAIGRMTLNQVVPVTDFGGLTQWSKAFGSRQFLTAGLDFRHVDGDSNEDALDAQRGTTVTLHRVSGGTQTSTGAFVQDLITPTDALAVTLSARVDHWRNYDAHNFETAVPSGAPTANNRVFPDRADTIASPRVAAIYHLTNAVSVWGDIGGGFRAPTLNELYRQFRVGAVLTLANDQLGPERLVGGEIGLNLSPAHNVTIRTTYFDNHMKNPVSNVTIATNTQQRQNLGRTHIRGLQSDVDYRLGSWRFSGGYIYDLATVTEFAANPSLVGNLLPQVPKNRASGQAAYSNSRFATVAVSVQYVGRQFDDDQNIRAVPGQPEPGLPGYTIADVMLSRAITRNFEAFFGVQNAFDEQYYVGTLPTTTGSPRLVNGGVRLRFSGR